MYDMKEYCYIVRFFDEEGEHVETEPFTTPAHNADHALWIIDDAVDEYCSEFGYHEAEITLEDVC